MAKNVLEFSLEFRYWIFVQLQSTTTVFPNLCWFAAPFALFKNILAQPQATIYLKKSVKFNILRNPKTYQGTHVCRGTPIENHCSMMTIAWKLIIFFQGSQSYKPFSPVNIEILISGRS